MNLRICSIYSTHELSISPTSYIRYKKLKCRTSEVHVQKLSNLIEIGMFYIRNYVFALHILHMNFLFLLRNFHFNCFVSTVVQKFVSTIVQKLPSRNVRLNMSFFLV